MRKALIPLSILTLALPGCGLFVGGRPTVTTHAAGCSSLIPPAWKEGVPGAEPPAGAATVGDWIAFGDEQTGNLDQANDRTVSTIGIVERCEERDAQAVRRATRRRFLGLF